MFSIGSRTHYAVWNNILFNFEYVRDCDYFVAHLKDAKRLTAKEEYEHDGFLNRVKVYASDRLGSNQDRKKRIKRWYENK